MLLDQNKTIYGDNVIRNGGWWWNWISPTPGYTRPHGSGAIIQKLNPPLPPTHFERGSLKIENQIKVICPVMIRVEWIQRHLLTP